MKHIVHVSNDFEPLSSGINTHLQNLLPELSKSDFKVTLLVPTGFKNSKEKITRNAKASNHYSIIRSYYKFTKNPIRKLFELTRSTQKGLRWIQETIKDIDLIHQHDQRATRLGASRFAYWQDTPIIWTNHSPDYFGRSEIVTRFLPKLTNIRPDGLIAVHESMAKLFNKSSYSNIPIKYIPNGVDINFFKSKKVIVKRDEIVVFSPQRMVPMKGTTYLAKAAREIYNESNLKINFKFAGSELSSNRDKNTIKKVKKLLESYHNENRVVYLGNPSYEKMPFYYQQADIIVLPLQVETENISVFEAWASGTPLITTEQVEKNGYMKHEENCLIVPNKDSQKLAEAIVRLANDSNLRETLAVNGRKLVENRFTWTQAARKTADFYREILNEGSE